MKVFLLKKVDIGRYDNAEKLSKKYRCFYKLGGVFAVSPSTVMAMTLSNNGGSDMCILRREDAVKDGGSLAVPLPENAPLYQAIDLSVGIILGKSVMVPIAPIYRISEGDRIFPDTEFREYLESLWYGGKKLDDGVDQE